MIKKKKKEIKRKATPLAGQIRVRFAPSPTGPLHIGGARTALFNYLFAKKQKGYFILRIEDTDTERSKLEWVQEIIEELKWLGLEWDEGPDIDGKFGPYKQSQRLDIYKKYLQKLLKEEKAYYCFCSSEELGAKRQDQMSRGLAPKYDGKCRNISKMEVEKNMKDGKPSVIRFKIISKKIRFNDLIRGEIEFNADLLGDIVIAKNLDTPLYHFSVVVDDFMMQISHVIRGEEHLSNTPRQILLQEAMDFSQPVYAHLPLMLNPDKSKMSKRAGDVAVSDYRKQGYLPEAIINFIALLGWNPGTEKEAFSLVDLIKEFSVGRVQKGGAVFDMQRLDFINSSYIKEKPIKKLTELCKPYFIEGYEKFSAKTLEKIVELYKARMKKLSDIKGLTDFFFAAPKPRRSEAGIPVSKTDLGNKLEYPKEMLTWKKVGDSETKESLEYSAKIISEIGNWNKKNLEEILLKEAEKFNKQKGYMEKDRGYLLWPLRVALSGKEASAGPFEIADILGKEKTLQRIQEAIESSP